MVVRSSLQSRKHSLIYQGLQVVQSLLPFDIHTPHTCRRETNQKNIDDKLKRYMWLTLAEA